MAESKEKIRARFALYWQRVKDDPRVKARARARANAWFRNNRARAFGYKLKASYGMSWSDWEALYDRQRGRCANPGCGVRFVDILADSVADKRLKPHVDHCHKTKRVRGLLCSLCNLALGTVHDDPRRLRGLIEYLRRAAA